MVNKRDKVTSVSFVLMLIISTFAFAYAIGSETKIVSAAEDVDMNSIRKVSNTYYARVIGTTDSYAQYSTSTKEWISTSLTSNSYLSGERVYESAFKTAFSTETPNTASVATGVTLNNQPVTLARDSGIDTDSIKVVGNDWYAKVPDKAWYMKYDPSTNSWVQAPIADDVYNGGTRDTYNNFRDSTTSVLDGTRDTGSVGDKKASGLPIQATGLSLGGQQVNSVPTLTNTNNVAFSLTAVKNGQTVEVGSIGAGQSFTLMQQTGEKGQTYQVKLQNGNIVDVDQATWNSLRSGKGVEYSMVKEGTLPKGSTPNSDGTWTMPNGGIYNPDTGKYSQGTMKTIFSDQTPFALGQIWQGVAWGATVAGLVLSIGGIFTKDQQSLNAAAGGLFAGIVVGKAWYGIFGKGGLTFTDSAKGGWATGKYTSWLGSPITAGVVGAATAWLVYNAMWSKETSSTETVTFNCLPWEAPHGGKDCELCNDADLPCSEYRCKSLGQSCAIVNKGTVEERCVNVNPRDVSSPVIKPNNADISDGYEYFDIVEMPPGAGFKIKSKTTPTGCIPAYTAIKFGIMTDEPSQCKIDIVPKGNYSQMATYLNGDNLYKYNHTELLNLPSSADLKNSSITLKNGKELTFYMRCRDAAGNANEADYALTVCVDPSPDNTAPLVQGTSIENKGCVPADSENATVQFYINEPSECRWDYYDKDFEQMNNNMSCSTSAIEINAIQSYTCNTLLRGVGRDGNNFYVRCKDQPEGIVNESKRNTNKESYVFNLRRSNQLKLKIVQPNETIYGVIRPTPVELYAETLFGCEDNKAICYYSATGAANSFVQFFDTDKSDGVHTQRLDLNDGNYNYYVRCVDSGGNVVNTTTTFRVSIDTNAPVVARAYEEEGYLKIVTPLNSECVYNSESCDYLFSEGTSMPYANSTTHVTEWFPEKKYFIKCRDQYRSEPVDCSLVIRPTENFLGA